MNNDKNEALIDLLIKQATEGLDEAETNELRRIERQPGLGEPPDLDVVAAAIGLIDIDAAEPMPAHLRSRVIADSERYFADREGSAVAQTVPESSGRPNSSEWKRPFVQWLGWGVAAAACVILFINLWLSRVPEPTKTMQSVQTAPVLTPEQKRQQLIDSATDLLTASVAAGNVPNLKDVSGDIVWSDANQAGYMRLRGLPANDRSKETYQLWIFDETQDPKTPIDGGTFDIDRNGEVIVPVNARLRAVRPKLFAVTIEKPGGVVVSKREKIALLAKSQSL